MEQMLLSLLTIAVFKSQQDTTTLETYGIEDSAAELPGELEGVGAEPLAMVGGWCANSYSSVQAVVRPTTDGSPAGNNTNSMAHGVGRFRVVVKT